MLRRLAALGRRAALVAGIMSPLASHFALNTGRGGFVALALAVLQTATVGVVLWGALPAGWPRLLAMLAPAALLLVLGACTSQSPQDGLLAAAGSSHALLHAGLLALFAASLLAGRTPLVTRLARRLNPAFHPGMEGYTRAVTIAWCLFFAAQLVASMVLLPLAPDAWRLFVTVLSLPSAALMALAEYGVRRWRFRGEAHTPLLTMIRSVRSGAFGRTP